MTLGKEHGPCLCWVSEWVSKISLKASAHSFKRFTLRHLNLSFSLYAPITWDECHAWFHLNAASPAARNTEQVNITKNFYLRWDSNHQHRTPCSPACSSNHSAIGTVDDMWLNLLQYLFTLRNWLSDILVICISFTYKDVVYFCLQNLYDNPLIVLAITKI